MPRSPSRDNADRFNGNRRYFRHWNRIDRLKFYGTALALLVGLGWLAADVLGWPKFQYQHTHGKVASVHAAWDANCEQCHTKTDTSTLGWQSVLFGTRERWAELSCQKCHSGPAYTGPDPSSRDAAKGHHASIIAPSGEPMLACSACHHDHNGRDFSLVKIADADCVRCHKDLKPYHIAGQPIYANAVTGFAKDHPEFRALSQPHVRTMKFSHALHMTRGVSRTPDGREAWKVSDIPVKELQARYRQAGKSDDDLVQLACSSCHQLDATLSDGTQRSGSPPRTDGAYFLPVNYDLHCKACHPVGATQTLGAERGAVVESFALPHGIRLHELDDLLDAEYARRLVGTKPVLPLSGKDDLTWRPDKKETAEVAQVRKEMKALSANAISRLIHEPADTPRPAGEPKDTGFKYSGCVLCHELTPGVDSSREIVPPNAPSIWLEHGKFDHAAHRQVDCRGCHAKAYDGLPADPKSLVEKGPVDLPDVKSCQKCHSPAGGIRHACVDCHRYHNGDLYKQGRGGAGRDPAVKLTPEEFLTGRKK